MSAPKKNAVRTIRAFGGYSDTGSSRPLNEDQYLAVVERQLFGVADGFGGGGIGDAAAKKALEDVRFFVDNGLGDSEVTLPFVYRTYLSASANLIFNAFLFANQRLYEENKKKHINARGGTSLIFAFFDGRHMILANTGLCSATLIRRGRAQELVRPRSYNAMRGVFSGSWNPKWAFPLMSLGQARDLEPEIVELRAEKGDLILLSTDGVYPYLTEQDLGEGFSLLTAKGDLEDGIRKQNQRLIEICTTKGAQDNQTLLTVLV